MKVIRHSSYQNSTIKISQNIIGLSKALNFILNKRLIAKRKPSQLQFVVHFFKYQDQLL